MKKFSLITLIIFSLLPLSCKKSNAGGLEDELSMLIGEWQWKKTEYVIGCQKHYERIYYSPFSESKQYSISFHKEGFIKLKEDGILTEKKIFEFSRVLQHEDHFSFNIYFEGDEEKRISGYTNGESMTLYHYPFKSTKDGCINCWNDFVK